MKKDRDNTEEQANTYPPVSDDIKARRKAVGALLAGAGVVGAAQNWSKPMIEAVVLPAHAETTRDGPSPPPPTSPSPPN